MTTNKKAAGFHQTAINTKHSYYNKAVLFDPISFYTKELSMVKCKGKTATALCPFHDDHNPSFSFYTDTGYFRCFACNTHGSLIDFCMLRYEMNYQEAIKYLSERTL